MTQAKALRQPLRLRLTSAGFLCIWMLIAAFPIFWIMVMSFKLPVDAFAKNPLDVIFGPGTRDAGFGLSPLTLLLAALVLYVSYRLASRYGATAARFLAMSQQRWTGWVVATIIFALVLFLVLFSVLPGITGTLRNLFGDGFLVDPIIGMTSVHYQSVWVGNEFYNNFFNSLLVTAGVVAVSLTVGTLAGYALARTGSSLAFWLLIIALVFRALPHSVLVAGYLPPFIDFGFYGQPWAVIVVLVSINQPFTIWMLRSFFMNIPGELDEAARVDGCSHFEAFRRVIMPVMWPGVITTGLFSFLLAYNDYLVTSLLLDAQSMTMVPSITQYFNRETTMTDQVEAIAAAVSIIAPLFLLVMVFQRQIVSGLTAGAVKG